MVGMRSVCLLEILLLLCPTTDPWHFNEWKVCRRNSWPTSPTRNATQTSLKTCLSKAMPARFPQRKWIEVMVSCGTCHTTALCIPVRINCEWSLMHLPNSPAHPWMITFLRGLIWQIILLVCCWGLERGEWHSSVTSSACSIRSEFPSSRETCFDFCGGLAVMWQMNSSNAECILTFLGPPVPQQ